MAESLISESLDFEVQTDILTLLENVKCQGNNPSGLKQALLTLAVIFNTSSASQEYFYMAGGVEELKSLLLEGSCPLTAVPAALYCLACAVRQNVTSQNAVLTQDMLSVIHELLSHSDSYDMLQQAAAFLLACTVTGSCRGQVLADETGCLQDLIHLFRECMTIGCGNENKWSVITKAIGFCVNNPQNVHNQQICCRVLPHTLKFISTEPRHQFISHVFSLICMVVANNVSNQDRIRRCGGIQILVEFIKKQVCLEDISVPINVVTLAVSAVDVCIADNEESGVQAGEQGLVPVLLDLLQESDLELSQVQIFILTLAHLLQSSRKHCQLVSEGRGYRILVNFLTEYQDEELFKVIKYILTLCKTGDNVQQQNDVTDEVNASNLQHPTRDLTTFLKENLGALYNLLNSIDNISETTQWMRNVNRTNEFMDGCDIQSSSSCSEKKMPDCDSYLEKSNFDYVPHHSSHHSESDEGVYIKPVLAAPGDSYAHYVQNSVLKSPSYIRDRWFTGNQGQKFVLNSYKERNFDAGSNQFVWSRDTRADMSRKHAKYAGTSRMNYHNQHGVQNLHHDAQTVVNIPSHELSAQSGSIDESTSWKDTHRSEIHCISSADSEVAKYHQDIYTSNKPSVCNKILQSNLLPMCDSSSGLGNTRNMNSHYGTWSNRNIRPDNIETSKFCQEKRHRKFLVQEGQIPNQSKRSMYLREQGHRESNSLSYVRQEEQTVGIVNDVQCSKFSSSDCKRPSTHLINTTSVSSEDHGTEKNPTTRAYVYSDGTVHSNPSVSSARWTKTVNNSCPLLNKQDCSHIQSSSSPCSTARLSAPHSVNSCTKNEKERRAFMSPHENQFDLYAKLQRVMSSFFQSLIPRQVDSCHKQRETREHSTPLKDHVCPNSPMMQTLNEQKLLHSDPTPFCENILSVCEAGDLSDEDGHREMLQTDFSCQSTAKIKLLDTEQDAKNQASQSMNGKLSENLKDNSCVTVYPEHCSQTLMQKFNTTSEIAVSASSEAKLNTIGSTGDAERVSHITVTSIDMFEDHKTFVKPSELPPSSTVNHRANSAGSNIRLASTSLTTHISVKTPVKSGNILPTPSPTLSQFDCQLRRMAHLSTNSKVATVQCPVTREPDESTSGFESMSTSEANGNMSSVWVSSEKKMDPVAACQVPSTHGSTLQSPKNVTCMSIPLYRRNVTALSASKYLLRLEKCLQPRKKAKTSGNLYKYERLTKKRKFGMKKADLGSDCPNYSQTSSCPGCAVGLHLNSCTYNIAIETSIHTCAYHRRVRLGEREYIHKELINKQTESGRTSVTRGTRDVRPGSTVPDVYEIESDSTELLPSATLGKSRNRRASVMQVNVPKQDVRPEVRRSRVLYTKQELLNLLEGVTKMGKRWQQILCTYEFHPSRTAVDLKDKYKKLQAPAEKQLEQTKAEIPFSMCEIRRLKSGVKHLGYNWKAILKGYKFHPGRTAVDLHKQWRSLNQIIFKT